jgi:aminoglycoside phosphotransferase (APT) family kinase protein
VTSERSALSLDEITSAVRADLLRDYGPSIDVQRVGDAMQGGFDNILVHLEIEGEAKPADWPRDVVVRVFPREALQGKAERERSVQEFCRTSGFPVPRVLATGSVGANAYLIMEFIQAPPSVVHLPLPWRIAPTMRTIARLHAQLHALPTSSWPSDGPTRTVDRWLHEMRTAANDISATDLEEPLAWLEANKGQGDTDELCVCHLDLTPINVLLRWGDTATVIDWDLAALADPVSDTAFLLEWFALAPATQKGLGAVIARPIMSFARRSFLREYTRHAEIDPTRLRYWRTLYSVLAQLWIRGATVGDVGTRESHTQGDAIPPRVGDVAAARFRALTTES